jgi:hypothetical protein
MPSSLHATPVPLTIKAVRQGAFTPTRRTILTLKNAEGYIIHEVVPDSEGAAKIDVEPGKYSLAAVGAREELKIEVLPPETTVTIQVSASGAPTLVSQTVEPTPVSQTVDQPNDRLSPLQQYQLWIGLGLLLLLLTFIIVAFFKPVLTADQRSILRFLSALCGGFAGAFITGDALFKMTGKTSTSEYAISGAAGFALFFVTWMFFSKVRDRYPDRP